MSALIVVAALALSAIGGRYVVPLLLRLASRSGDAGRAAGSGASPPPDQAGPLRGGAWIGALERVAVTGCLLAGYPAGIAFVIAIKGLGRYPELREHPGSSERFVIGTLGSLVWAAGWGLLGAALLGTRMVGI